MAMKRLKTAASPAASAGAITSLRIPLPDDFHHHFRDGREKGDGRLELVAPLAAAQFGRCLVMPNLTPPVTTCTAALEYRERILKAVGEENLRRGFQPLMTLYLTETTPVSEIDAIKNSDGKIVAVKLYPAGATTNSHFGVTSLTKVEPVLKRMAELGIPLLIHGEVVDPAVDVFDREAVFLERELKPLVSRQPNLRIVLEHVTTKEAVDFVLASGENVAATMTPQHLLLDRNALFQGGLRPHAYCLPILKRGNPHRLALLDAIRSGSPKFFLGTDSAPHAVHTKEAECGCAGCFTALTALELYLEAFEEAGALEHFQSFACENGAKFYGLPLNPFNKFVTLEKKPRAVPAKLPFTKLAAKAEEADQTQYIVPLRGGGETKWSVTGVVDA